MVSHHWPATTLPDPHLQIQIIVELPFRKRCVHWVCEISLTVSRLSSTSSLSDFLRGVSDKNVNSRYHFANLVLLLFFPLPPCHIDANLIRYPRFCRTCHRNIGLPLVNPLLTWFKLKLCQRQFLATDLVLLTTQISPTSHAR